MFPLRGRALSHTLIGLSGPIAGASSPPDDPPGSEVGPSTQSTLPIAAFLTDFWSVAKTMIILLWFNLRLVQFRELPTDIRHVELCELLSDGCELVT